MDQDQDDVGDVIREERSRGRRPIDTKTLRERQVLWQGLLKLLQEGDERKFLSALRGLGLRDDSSEFQAILKLWREFLQRRKQSF